MVALPRNFPQSVVGEPSRAQLGLRNLRPRHPIDGQTGRSANRAQALNTASLTVSVRWSGVHQDLPRITLREWL